MTRPAGGDPAEVFRRKARQNADAWLGFVLDHQHDRAALDRELDNVIKAVFHATPDPDALDSSLHLVQVLWPHVDLRGRWLAWEPTLERAVEASRRAGRQQDEASLLVQLAELSRTIGKPARSLDCLTAARTLFEQLDQPAEVARTLALASQAYLTLGQPQLADACCRDAAALAATLDDRKTLALIHNNWGIVCLDLGDPAAAAEHFTAADRLFRQAGKLRGQAKAVANIGAVRHMQGQLAEALAAYDQAAELYLLTGDELNAARTRANLAILAHQQGRTADALALAEPLEPVFSRLGDQPWLARIVNNQGAFLQALGRPADALDRYERAARLYLDAGDTRFACSSLVNCADALLDQGRRDEAAARLVEATALLDTLDPPPAWLLAEVDQQTARLAG